MSFPPVRWFINTVPSPFTLRHFRMFSTLFHRSPPMWSVLNSIIHSHALLLFVVLSKTRSSAGHLDRNLLCYSSAGRHAHLVWQIWPFRPAAPFTTMFHQVGCSLRHFLTINQLTRRPAFLNGASVTCVFAPIWLERLLPSFEFWVF